MKSEEEKKSRQVSIRLTKGQYKLAEQKAKERNMSINAMIGEMLEHGNNNFTPFHLMQVQNLVNEAAEACRSVNPELAEELSGKVDALWLSF